MLEKSLEQGKIHIYWANNGKEHYIGTDDFIVRLPKIPEKLKEVLKQYGLEEPGYSHCKRRHNIISPNQIIRRFELIKSLKQRCYAIKTPFAYFAYNKIYRIFITEKDQIYVNNTIIEEIENMFKELKDTEYIWSTTTTGKCLVYGNYLAIVYPQIIEETKYYLNIRKQSPA